MCSAPNVPEAQKFQQSQSPVYRDRKDAGATGRRGTILTGGSGVGRGGGSSIQSSSPTLKKTALGQ